MQTQPVGSYWRREKLNLQMEHHPNGTHAIVFFLFSKAQFAAVKKSGGGCDAAISAEQRKHSCNSNLTGMCGDW